MILRGLTIIANLLGMVVASGYARSTSTARIDRDSSRAGMPRGGDPPPGAPRWTEGDCPEVLQSKQIASRIFADAGANRDGSLSADEAAVAASSFVKSVPGTHPESIDAATLRESLRLGHLPDHPDRPAEGLRRGAAPDDDSRTSVVAP